MLFPLAAAVATTTLAPRLRASTASAWWLYSESTPISLRASESRALRGGSRSPYTGSLGGTCWTWTIWPWYEGRVSRRPRNESTSI